VGVLVGVGVTVGKGVRERPGIGDRRGNKLIGVVTGLAARDADRELLGRLQLLDARGTIAHASEPVFVTHALGDALADADQHGRIASWLAAALGNPAVNAEAWLFLKSRWNDLAPRLTEDPTDARAQHSPTACTLPSSSTDSSRTVKPQMRRRCLSISGTLSPRGRRL